MASSSDDTHVLAKINENLKKYQEMYTKIKNLKIEDEKRITFSKELHKIAEELITTFNLHLTLGKSLAEKLTRIKNMARQMQSAQNKTEDMQKYFTIIDTNLRIIKEELANTPVRRSTGEETKEPREMLHTRDARAVGAKKAVSPASPATPEKSPGSKHELLDSFRLFLSFHDTILEAILDLTRTPDPSLLKKDHFSKLLDFSKKMVASVPEDLLKKYRTFHDVLLNCVKTCEVLTQTPRTVRETRTFIENLNKLQKYAELFSKIFEVEIAMNAETALHSPADFPKSGAGAGVGRELRAEVKKRLEIPKSSYGPSSEARVTTFTRLLKKYVGEPVSISPRGYLYPEGEGMNRFFSGNALITERGKYQGQQLSSRETYDNLHKDLTSGTKAERELAERILSSEYKIHFMPKPEYMWYVVEKLLKLCHDNPRLRGMISYLKIIDTSNVGEGEGLGREVVPAAIVLYPSLGKDYAQEVLNTLYEAFTPEEAEEIGINKTPRMNRQINSLLYYAQSGYDFKKLVHPEELTKQKAHFKFGERLEHPVVRGGREGSKP